MKTMKTENPIKCGRRTDTPVAHAIRLVGVVVSSALLIPRILLSVCCHSLGLAVHAIRDVYDTMKDIAVLCVVLACIMYEFDMPCCSECAEGM